VAPQVEGVKTYGVSVAEARSYINWIPFYATWKVSVDSTEAKDLRADANKLLDELEQVANDSIKARIGVLPAYRNGEAIVVANERIEMLRQQTVNDSDVSLSLCDFVAPADDYVGVFAVCVGSAINAMIHEANDEYRVMLLQTVADRLVEAATECVHARVRKELWGYASEENENPENLLRQYYQGVRPAVGYPSLPDQSVIFQLDRLLDLSEIDVSLTENGAMSPASSICGLMLAHPESRYFVIGEIGDDQRADYAQRKGFTKEEMNKFLK
jgi:5-methyltetrahydrofolate--homocysteine methyltransferase